MDLKLIVRDGVLLTETAEAVVGDGAWTATGVLNLPLQRIDLRLIQTLPAPNAKLGAAGGRPAVLELRGPWSQPLIRSLSEPNSASGSGSEAPSKARPSPEPAANRG